MDAHLPNSTAPQRYFSSWHNFHVFKWCFKQHLITFSVSISVWFACTYTYTSFNTRYVPFQIVVSTDQKVLTVPTRVPPTALTSTPPQGPQFSQQGTDSSPLSQQTVIIIAWPPLRRLTLLWSGKNTIVSCSITLKETLSGKKNWCRVVRKQGFYWYYFMLNYSSNRSF